MYIIIAEELKIEFISSFSFLHILKNKKPVSKITLRRVTITRGTTQIADTNNLPLFEVCQLLCTNVAFTGNAYLIFKTFRASGSEVMGHWKIQPLARSNRQLSQGFVIRPSSSTPLKMQYLIIAHYTPMFFICQYFFEIFSVKL